MKTLSNIFFALAFAMFIFAAVPKWGGYWLGDLMLIIIAIGFAVSAMLMRNNYNNHI